MEGTKIYLQPKKLIYDTVLDIAELQKGKVLFGSAESGQIRFGVSMYGIKWELLYTVTDIGKNRSRVQIEIIGEKRNKERQIYREFALLDAMLIARTQIEITAQEQSGTEQEDA